MKHRTRMVRWAVGLAGAATLFLAWGIVRGSSDADGDAGAPLHDTFRLLDLSTDADEAPTLPAAVPSDSVRTRTRGS